MKLVSLNEKLADNFQYEVVVNLDQVTYLEPLKDGSTRINFEYDHITVEETMEEIIKRGKAR